MRWWNREVKKFQPLPPVAVNDAPVKQNVKQGKDINLKIFPWARWHEKDGGGYMCASSTVTRDPESGYYPLATCWCTVSHIGVTGSATGCERIRDVQWYHMRGAAVIFLAISSLLLSSCADFKSPPDQPWSNRYRRPGSGDCTFRCGSELGFWA